jgi:hypothetical protein
LQGISDGVRRRHSRLQPDLIVISNGKMRFREKEILQMDGFFHCCYETCNFKLEKAKTDTDEESCGLILNHIQQTHIGKFILAFECLFPDRSENTISNF